MSSWWCCGWCWWNTSLNWAAGISFNNSSDVSFWTWTMSQFNTLAFIALTAVCAAAFVILCGNQVLIVFTSWNGFWTGNYFAAGWFTCVLATALINDMSDLNFGFLAWNTCVTTISLSSSDIVNSIASVDCAWFRWNSPAFTIASLTAFNINTNCNWSNSCDMGDWSMSDCNGGGCGGSSSCWNSLSLAALSNWATCISVNNSSSITSWAGLFGKMETLVLVAFAVVFAATAIFINALADEIFIAGTFWSGYFWTFVTFFFWAGGAAWSTAACVNFVCSDLIGTGFAFNNFTSIL